MPLLPLVLLFCIFCSFASCAVVTVTTGTPKEAPAVLRIERNAPAVEIDEVHKEAKK